MNNMSNFLQAWVAYLTWLVIFIISLNLLRESPFLFEAALYQLLMLLCLWLATSANFKTPQINWPLIALWLMLFIILLLGWRIVLSLFFIYSIIWIAVAVHHLSVRTCWLMLALISIAWYFIRIFSWQDTNAFTDTILVATFHAFGLVSSLSTLASTQANERTQELNRELIATQHLLGEASKENERTRIARDLHDLLGHHLTALTINLQVATHLTDGEAKEKVEQCHGLAKLLLSDVREAVSTLRETPILGLRELLELAAKDVPRISIKLEVDQDINLNDVNTAEALLRSVQEAITNSLRHSNASHMVIRASSAGDSLKLRITDDGDSRKPVVVGNGLKGMRERLVRLGGQLEFSNSNGFNINIEIPFRSHL